MIKLKQLLREMSEEDVNRLLEKINQKQFSFFDKENISSIILSQLSS